MMSKRRAQEVPTILATESMRRDRVLMTMDVVSVEDDMSVPRPA